MSKTAQRKRSAFQAGYNPNLPKFADGRKHRFNGSYRLGQYLRSIHTKNAQTEGAQS